MLLTTLLESRPLEETRDPLYSRRSRQMLPLLALWLAGPADSADHRMTRTFGQEPKMPSRRQSCCGWASSPRPAP